MEDQVSMFLRSKLWFRCVEIRDRVERNRFESLLIATIAACSVCRPSRQWLGQQAYSLDIRNTGLWNSQYVGGLALDDEAIGRFAEFVKATRRYGWS